MGRTVLVVDDDQAFRRLAAQVLEAWGHAVVGEAGGVAEALQLAGRVMPSTVLADIGLPDGDGFALTTRLLELPDPPRVILISSDADHGHDAAARVGAVGFVPKDALASSALRNMVEGRGEPEPAPQGEAVTAEARTARSVVLELYDHYNARNMDAWEAMWSPDGVMNADGTIIHGPAAAREAAEFVQESFPGMIVRIPRIIEAGDDTFVLETAFENPARERAGAASWLLRGTALALVVVRDGRIAEMQHFSSVHPADSNRLADTSVRLSAGRVVDEHSALRDVAGLVIQGAAEQDVFSAVIEAVARTTGADSAALLALADDDTAELLATWSDPPMDLPVGERRPMTAELCRLRDEGTTIRREAPTEWSPFGASSAALGHRSIVGVPVTLDGAVWGVVLAASRSQDPLPADTEHRLHAFTELVSSALASARSRAALQRLADEQAALRRIAEHVADGVPLDEILRVVVDEVATLLKTDRTTLRRFDGGEADVVALEEDDDGAPPLSPVVDAAIVEKVRRSGAVTRAADDHGSTVAAPITVEGRPWGALIAWRRASFAASDDRLVQFASLVGTAVDRAEARDALRAVAAEQAALRRVAELVARNVAPHELFDAVALEASRLVGDHPMSLLRFDGPDVTVLAAHGGGPPDTQPWTLPPGGGRSYGRVLVSGAPVRTRVVDERSATPGPGRWFVGVPIVVDDRVWGMLCTTTSVATPADDLEARMSQFADLVAASLANTHAKATIHELAEEQSALRRVAEQAAKTGPPEDVFATVAAEASGLLGGAGTSLSRFDAPTSATIVAIHNSPLAVGLAIDTAGGSSHALVRRTGQPCRVREDADGALAATGTVTVGAPVIVEGRLWGVLAMAFVDHEPPPNTERRLVKFGELAGLAVASAEHRRQLRDSRARVVAAADESRRGLQRDLHDGAQQRLVQAIVNLQLAASNATDHDCRAASFIEESLRHARQAHADLRDLVRGILPAALTRGGLRAGVESLVADLPLDVAVDVTAERFPPALETTGYFVVAEALANVVKHANARRASIRVSSDATGLVVEVRDDGVGGADATRGTGLIGLADRVEALDGRLSVTSPPEGGTSVRAVVPAGVASHGRAATVPAYDVLGGNGRRVVGGRERDGLGGDAR